jgi:hypothetical protein
MVMSECSTFLALCRWSFRDRTSFDREDLPFFSTKAIITSKRSERLPEYRKGISGVWTDMKAR